ncbi:hypothetical protein AJ87_19695 [Rhizobium yanglingense]|nr:hypothetical protein AJ87_19695 [Rhizobium yanglingense]
MVFLSVAWRGELSRLECFPGGSPGSGIGFIVIAAIDAQGLLAERRVDEIAVMRPGRIRMREGREVTTGNAHALDGNGVHLLQALDHLDERQQQILLLTAIEGADRLLGEAVVRLSREQCGHAFRCHCDANRAPVGLARRERITASPTGLTNEAISPMERSLMKCAFARAKSVRLPFARLARVIA